jgi:hypothetical protein
VKQHTSERINAMEYIDYENECCGLLRAGRVHTIDMKPFSYVKEIYQYEPLDFNY